MNENSTDTVPKATVAKILSKILEVYNCDDETRKSDFFAKELPEYIKSNNFEYNPREN